MSFRSNSDSEHPAPARSKPGEFDLIRQLTAGLPLSQRTLLGPGDDCAILAPVRVPQLLTIDSMVEGVHFKLSWAPAAAWGARALTINLSDIAAMGGNPTACMVNLAVPERPALGVVKRLYGGLRRAAVSAGLDIVGGNITREKSLAITVAMLGVLHAKPLRRDAARAGDEIFVTGTLGDAAAGWRVLDGRLQARGADRRFLIERFVNPPARLLQGQRLTRIEPTPAAIDISDGLWQDLGHILERSGVGAELDPRSIPCSSAYRAAMGDDLSLSLSGGEDYELLFCLRPGLSERELTRRLGVPVRRIGRIVKGRRARLLGQEDRFKGLKRFLGGWDHLRPSPRA